MKIYTQLVSQGKSVKELIEALTNEWVSLNNYEVSSLPNDAEISIEKNESLKMYIANCTIRTKIEL